MKTKIALTEEFINRFFEIINKFPNVNAALYTTDPVYTINFYVSCDNIEVFSSLIKKYEAKEVNQLDYFMLKTVFHSKKNHELHQK